ncbi:MFS transporter [Glacieibacterium sp.]|uniref:MFS transporter n=1 Tax=Glacieibacterium sp. TaxID=2860237 RepID=UPI003B00F4E3
MTGANALDAAPEWQPQPHERASMPGSPATPDHPAMRRLAYGLTSALVGLTGSLGNALVTVNLYNLQGSLGLYTYEIVWLPTAYVMTNVCINLLLIKFRQQFGLRLFTQIFLVGYVLATFAHLFVHSFASAIIVRAASGMTAAALSTLGLLYMIQAFPAKWRIKALVLAVAIPQLATPIARLFSSTLLEVDQWRTLYIFELGLGLLSLAAVRMLALPPSERSKAFEPLDFLTFALFAPGMALLCAVLGVGRYLWWTEAPWLGVALCLSFVLIPAALLVEHHRRNPLLNTRWLGSGDIVRFALVAILTRMVLSEQTYGSVGLLQVLGIGNDQMHTLYVIVLVAMIVGTVVSAFTIDPNFLGLQLLIALAIIAVGAWLDTYSTDLTRPQDIWLSQAMLAFAAALFIGPALVIGLTRAMAQGPGHFVSFSALFGITQNVGGLLGSAMLGTFQQIRERVHSQAIVQHLTMIDPLVAARIQSGGGAVGRVIGDPALRSAEGAVLLSQAATREANVLAYNDVFLLICVVAVLTFVWATTHVVRIRRATLRALRDA